MIARSLSRAASVLVCSVLLAACATPSRVPVRAEPPPARFRVEAETAFKLGAILKAYDDAAAQATDTASAFDVAGREHGHGTYLVEPLGDGHRVIFVSRDPEAFGVIAAIDVAPGPGFGTVSGIRIFDRPRPLDKAEQRLYDALMAAVTSSVQVCNGAYNTEVIPYQHHGTLEYRVYLLRAQTDADTIPVGGHALVRVAADAKTVLEVRELSRSCLDSPAPKADAVAMMASDGALDVPSAAHVFLMLEYHKPVYLMTRNRILWRIDSRGIQVLQ